MRRPHRSAPSAATLTLVLAACALLPIPAAAQPPHACQLDRAPAGTPDEIRIRAMGWHVEPSPARSSPDLRVWILRGRPIREGHPDRFSRLIAIDETSGEVLEGVPLFRRLESGGSPADQARAALSTVIWRAGQEPLTPADAPGLDPAAAAVVRAPRVEGRTLIFWVRPLPGGQWAREVRVDLDSGRANVGAVFS